MVDILTHSTLTTGLVSYWELEEASGNRVDVHGPNDLTSVNSVGQATGIQGNGADMEDSSSQYLYITDAAQTGLKPTNDFSFSFWINLESLPAVSYPVNKGNLDSALNYRVEVGSTGYIAFFVRRSAGNYNITSATGVITTGAWKHVVCVKRSTGTGMTLYVNNTSVASGGGTLAAVTSTDPFMMGARRSIAAPENYIDGVIDEFGFWSKALTTTEIADLYNSGAGLPYDAGGGATFLPRIMQY